MTIPPGRQELDDFYRLEALDAVPSTNDEALARAAAGAPEGTLITARSQSAGRGRRGRQWESAEGNLFLSLVLRPEGGIAAAAAIGFAGGLAVAETLDEALGGSADIALKWPNDVLVGGRKASGLLIERAGSGAGAALVLGVGINLVSHPEGTAFPATDVVAAGGTRLTPDAALAGFRAAFLARYRQWQSDGFAPLRADWLARARGLGRPITVEIEGRRYDGIFRGIDADGALELDLGAGGVKKITAGDVFFPGFARGAAC
ncbi:MAG: biotin--[acetyl-CoA-carboxylase] ligase [Alphaproteobacteria bacterium]|nr:biotin--[acetyl-CoA-carboxylase] ligase [Alphaproteobacteria bacterium]